MKSKFEKIMTDVVKFSAIQFAQECRDINSIEELQAAIEAPDATDMEQWNLTQAEYIWALEAAIYAIQNDAAISDDGRIPL